MIIKIDIMKKRPSVVGAPIIVCGNSGYTIEFTFDSEWDVHSAKTARFVYIEAGKVKYKDVEFTGNTAEVPVLSNIREVLVGVYAGDLRTTTSARIPCDYSILCLKGEDQTTGQEMPTLQAQIGDLSKLETSDKSSLVAAINETAQSGGGGLPDTARALLITILRNGVYDSDQSANITDLETVLGSSSDSGSSGGDTGSDSGETEVTLTSIVATYSGGDVAVGTAVNDLTGIVVTAHYSDGSSATVTDYTLSGTIAEGENIITVSYGGKTTTFTVTGVAESSGNTTTLLYDWDFTQSLTDTVAGNMAVLNGDGTTQDNNGITLSQSENTSTNYVSFSENIHGANRRYEIDIVSFDSTDATDRFNNFLLSIYHLTGLFFTSNKWQFYTGNGWVFVDTGNADISIFNGKTAVIEINADYSWTVYADDTLMFESNTPMYANANGATSNVITLGSNGAGSAYTDMVITGLRVYDLGGV